MATENALLLSMVGALAGSMVFFALIVAPKVFQALSPDQASIFLRSFFPSYYLWGLLLATASTLIAVWADAILTLACAAVAVLFAYSRQSLVNSKPNSPRGHPDAASRGAVFLVPT